MLAISTYHAHLQPPIGIGCGARYWINLGDAGTLLAARGQGLHQQTRRSSRHAADCRQSSSGRVQVLNELQPAAADCRGDLEETMARRAWAAPRPVSIRPGQGQPCFSSTAGS